MARKNRPKSFKYAKNYFDISIVKIASHLNPTAYIFVLPLNFSIVDPELQAVGLGEIDLKEEVAEAVEDVDAAEEEEKPDFYV